MTDLLNELIVPEVVQNLLQELVALQTYKATPLIPSEDRVEEILREFHQNGFAVFQTWNEVSDTYKARLTRIVPEKYPTYFSIAWTAYDFKKDIFVDHEVVGNEAAVMAVYEKLGPAPMNVKIVDSEGFQHSWSYPSGWKKFR